jgi:ribosome biogenesis GTPase
MLNHSLPEFGWDASWEKAFEPYKPQGLVPARISREEKELYLIYSEQGEISAEVTGKYRHEANLRSDYPAVGDWVAVQPLPGEERAMIHALLPRRTRFSRKEAWVNTEEQVIAANVDTVFLMTGLDRDYNLRRIERYLVLAWESGAQPVILLNKADLCSEVAERVAEVGGIAFDVPIHPISAMENQGLEALAPYLMPGKTIALLGSSGVGKSTLINTLLGEERQEVGAVRESDGRGRHITSRRELILLPSGALLIDNPGMREIQMWGDEQGLSGAFEDVEALARGCRFRDCRHEKETGCAVREALDIGALDPDRFKSYLKLQRELRFLARRQDQKLRQEEKAKWKKISQWQKALEKSKFKGDYA